MFAASADMFVHKRVSQIEPNRAAHSKAPEYMSWFGAMAGRIRGDTL